MTIKIRRGVAADARQIAIVHIDSWQAIYRGNLPDHLLDNLSLDHREQEWHERLVTGVQVWVVDDDTRIIGFASVSPSRDHDTNPETVAEITALYLIQEEWRKGIGKKLCQFVFDELRRQNYQEVTLWVL